MKEWINKIFADKDGIPDEARVAAFLLVLTYISGSISAVVLSPTHMFDMLAFGGGAAALGTGIGAWFGIRRDN